MNPIKVAHIAGIAAKTARANRRPRCIPSGALRKSIQTWVRPN